MGREDVEDGVPAPPVTGDDFGREDDMACHGFTSFNGVCNPLRQRPPFGSTKASLNGDDCSPREAGDSR